MPSSFCCGRVGAVVCGFHLPRARYSIAKFRSFAQYRTSTGMLRHLAVIALMPVPALLLSVLVALLPLREPALGVRSNTVFFVHFFFTIGAFAISGLLQIRAATGITHDDFRTRDVFAIAAVTTLFLVAYLVLVACTWRFPVPFTWVLVYPPGMLALVGGCALVLGHRWRQLQSQIFAFLPPLFIQGSQLMLYPAFSAVYESVGEWGQVALTCAFPLLKYALKGIVRHLSRMHPALLRGEELPFAAVEISASMYQSMVMRGLPFPLATAFVIGLDIAISLASVRALVRREGSASALTMLADAHELLDSLALSNDEELQAFASIRRPPRIAISLRRVGMSVESGDAWFSSARTATVTLVSPPRSQPLQELQAKEAKRRVTHALEVLHGVESIVLVEYIEVVVPLANAAFLVLATQLDSARFNPSLQPLCADSARLVFVVQLLAQYTLLQCVSILVLVVALRRLYGLSTVTMLAFVLERHAWSLQGKLIGWLVAMFHFSVLHYGVDYSFRFDFTEAMAISSEGG